MGTVTWTNERLLDEVRRLQFRWDTAVNLATEAIAQADKYRRMLERAEIL